MTDHTEKGFAATEYDLAFTQSFARRIHIHLARHNWSGAIKLIEQCRAACSEARHVVPPSLVRNAALLPREVVRKLLDAGFVRIDEIIVASDERLLLAGLCSREISTLDHSISEYCLCRDPELGNLFSEK